MLLVRLPVSLSDLLKIFYLNVYVLNSNKLTISMHQNMKVNKREICYLFLNFPLSLTQAEGYTVIFFCTFFSFFFFF